MRYTIRYSGLFKRSFKRCMKRGLDVGAFRMVAETLGNAGTLPARYKPHKLSGNYRGCWECHITPDWLLVWEQDDDELTLLFIDTGSHSDLFG